MTDSQKRETMANFRFDGTQNTIAQSIVDTIKQTIGSNKMSKMTFFDIFAGAGSISATIKKDVKKVITNDVLLHNFILNKHFICNDEDVLSAEIFHELNNLPPKKKDNFLLQYTEKGEDKTLLIEQNAELIGAIRDKIEEYKDSGVVDDRGYYHLLSSLIVHMMMTIGANNLNNAPSRGMPPAGYKKFKMHPLFIYKRDSKEPCETYNEKGDKIACKISSDIMYFNPMTQTTNHVWKYFFFNSVINNKKTIPVFGNVSSIGENVSGLALFKNIIEESRSSDIFITYNDKRKTLKPIAFRSILEEYGVLQKIKLLPNKLQNDKIKSKDRRYNEQFYFIYHLQKTQQG